MKNVSIGITTFEEREELVYKLIDDIKNIAPDIDIIITVNNKVLGNASEGYRQRMLAYCSSINNCYPIFCPEFKSLSKLWNTIVIFSKTEYNLILNDDVEINNQLCISRIEQAINETDHEVFTINGGWSHFVITKHLLHDIGYFDERLIAFGEEDGDFVHRYINKYGMVVPALLVDGIRNICAYDRSDANTENHIHNKPVINRKIAECMYREDSNGICGMSPVPVRKVMPDLQQYPYEIFFIKNKHNISKFTNIDF